MTDTSKITILGDDGGERELPSKFEVCDNCRGNGTHVNRAIDGNGLSAEDFDEAGPEFFEDYMSGLYDVPCDVCAGRRVVAVIDEDRCDPADVEQYWEEQKELADMLAEEAAERRMGA